MARHDICDAAELDAGDRIVVQLEGREIAVFNNDEEYFAYVNWCPHQGGPACEGLISGTQEATLDEETKEVSLEWAREDKIVNCPWHGWEFDITTGDCLSRPPVKLPSYPVTEEDGRIVVDL